MDQQITSRRRNDYVSSSFFIHDSIIAEILLRTPASSVLKFKSVCKQWYSIIKDPQFIRKHVDHPRKNPSVSFAVLYYVGDDWYVDDHRLITFDYEEALTSNRVADDIPMLTVPETKGYIDHTLMVACKGLVCIYSWYIHICNPTTKELVTLPVKAERVGVNPVGDGLDFGFGFGFGYDSVNRRYKVVQLLPEFLGDPEHQYDVFLNVFTLGDSSKSWRTTTLTANGVDFPCSYGPGYDTIGRHVDGSIYWLMSNHAPHVCTNILCFDVRDETLRFIKLPDGYEFSYDSYKSMLVDLNESQLGIVKHDDVRHTMDIWLLKTDSTQDLWTKEYRLDVSSIGNDNPFSSFPHRIPTKKIVNEKVLFKTAKGLVSYDLQNNRSEQVFETSACAKEFEVNVYMQTMMSLHDMVM